MKYQEALEKLSERAGPFPGKNAVMARLRTDARALWAVRVLDAYAVSKGCLAAAQAVFPTLDAETQAKLGECP